MNKTYEISISIKCLRCGRTSHNPEDVRNLYCGYCGQFHYTHEGENGIKWRMAGSRPVSEVADRVMKECGLEPLPKMCQPGEAENEGQ